MFGIFRIRQYYPRAIRGIQIVTILFKFVLINWMSTRRFFFRFIPQKYKRDGAVKSQPERLRTVIEELGPTFIKFGQIVADRPDIVSEKLRNELKKLQAKAEPFDHDLARQLMEAQLGGPIDTFFTELNMECIGSASIGQVYKARLKATGEEVVIKIQRPNIETKIELDLAILRYLAQQLIEEYPGFMAVDIIGVVDEFGETLMRELNYLNEAGNAIRFAEMFANVPYCKIPRVYMDLTTDKMLVMEYVSGIAPDRVDVLIENGLDPKEIAKNGVTVLLEMIFRHGFFHADPHAGNMFIQPGNRIALIDFGMAGTLKPAHMHFLAGFTLGLALNNPTIITDSLLTLCGKKFFAEKDNLEFSVHDMLTRFGSFSYDKMNFSQILNESIKIILKYELKLPSSIYLLLKAIATAEKFGYNLDPHVSLPVLIRPYAEQLVQEKFSAKEIAGDIFDTIKDYIAFFRDFPSEANEILFKLKQGKITMDIHLTDQDTIIKSVKQLGSLLAVALIIGFMLAGSSLMLLKGLDSTGVNIMFGVSLFFAIWMLLRLFIKTRL